MIATEYVAVIIVMPLGMQGKGDVRLFIKFLLPPPSCPNHREFPSEAEIDKIDYEKIES
jgi:hypothetical protein